MFTPLRAVAAVVAVTVVLVLAERAVEDRAPAPRDERVTATNVDTYPTRRATLPPGIRVIEEPTGFVATRDVLPGVLRLPSGRVAADAYFTGETEPLAERGTPGPHPVSVTLARSVRARTTARTWRSPRSN